MRNGYWLVYHMLMEALFVLKDGCVVDRHIFHGRDMGEKRFSRGQKIHYKKLITFYVISTNGDCVTHLTLLLPEKVIHKQKIAL